MNKYMKIKPFILQILTVAVLGFTMSGCTSLRESFASQMEVPTLEKQANRVSIGMAIVRENNIMAFNMPISADASWPKEISAELEDEQEQHIADMLQQHEPYFATVHYTESMQRQMLGSSFMLNSLGRYANAVASVMNQTISPITYKAIQKLEAFYGDDISNWPDLFDNAGSDGDFLDFKGGELKEVEALSGDVYESIGEALISLTPMGMQKDLSSSRSEMLNSYDDVTAIQSEKGHIDTNLKSDKISSSEKDQLEQDLALVEERINEAESIADEKELIYFTLLDGAVVALESEINIDDENYVKLAQNINIVAQEIQIGATQAYTSFALSLTNIIANNILFKLPKELESLAYGKAYVPARLQKKYNQRIGRLVQNSLYLLPNIFIGTYYANKQSNLAEKYQAITEMIVEAYDVKMEQEKEAKEAEEKEAEKAEETKG